MKYENRKKLGALIDKVKYARGGEQFEPFTLTLLSFLDGYLTGVDDTDNNLLFTTTDDKLKDF